MRITNEPVRRLIAVLVDPTATTRSIAAEPNAVSLALVLFAISLLLGAVALPRQLDVLNEALAPMGHAALDLHHRAMRSGLTRVIVADRLMPPPTVLLAAGLVVLVSDPLLVLPTERRPSLWSVVLLGLAPLLVQEIGELALTYLAAPADPTPGDAVALGSRFITGPLLLWRGDFAAPYWLEVVDARLNLITLWCALLWVFGLRAVGGGPLRAWHVAVPLSSLGMAGVITWIINPLVVRALLSSP
jgi:hypothetical protein